MKRLVLGLVLLLPLFSMVFAEENCYWKADRDLQRVYEHFEGISLKEAIDQLLVEKYGSFKGNNNVQIRFNGGGMRNHLFIGRKNTMEILVKNDFVLGAVTLCFEFSCTGGPGSFEWATRDSAANYITYTPHNSPVPDCLEIHPDAFNAGGNYWITSSGAHDYPNKIKVGGYRWPGYMYDLPVHTSETLLYSLTIWVPDDMSLVGETFYVDNILLPPDNVWMFADTTASNQIAPDFQNIPNGGIHNPSAPPVAFTIEEPRCEYARNSNDPNMAYPDDDEVRFPENKLDYDNYPGVYVRRGGTRMIGVLIKFDGNEDDLKALGVEIDSLKYNGWIITGFPLTILPKVCQIEGVIRIKPPQVAVPYLNYSTSDINCAYAINQDSLGVSGDSVILGIIDTGIDWLHEDFIDSNGLTRILYFWDQTDSTGTNPSGYNYGSEYDSSKIQDSITQSRPGKDLNGHGTHVAGIASGNNRSGGSQDFVGVAPKVNIVMVKYSSWPTSIQDAIRYIAQKANQLDLPWTINMSIGLNYIFPETHRGNHPWETFIDSIVTDPNPDFGDGRIIVTAAGNSGDDSLHASRFGPGDVELNVQTNSAYADTSDSLWIYILYPKIGVVDAEVQIIAPNHTYDVVPIYCSSNIRSKSGWVVNTVNTDGMIRVCHEYFDNHYIVDPIDEGHTEDNLIIIQIQDGYYNSQLYQMSSGTWTIRMDGIGLGVWDAYIYKFQKDTVIYPKKFIGSTVNRIHTTTSPANAKKAITIGSVNSSRPYWDSPLGRMNVPSGYPPRPDFAFFKHGASTRWHTKT